MYFRLPGEKVSFCGLTRSLLGDAPALRDTPSTAGGCVSVRGVFPPRGRLVLAINRQLWPSTAKVGSRYTYNLNGPGCLWAAAPWVCPGCRRDDPFSPLPLLVDKDLAVDKPLDALPVAFTQRHPGRRIDILD